MRFLKNSRQQLARKIVEKAHILNNNSLVDNHYTRQVGEIKKGGKYAKKRSVAPIQSQVYNTYVPTPNPGTNSQTTKKQSYNSVAV